MVLDRLKLDIQCDMKFLAGASTLHSHFCVDMVNICICLMLDKAPILECTLQFAWTALIITLQLWLVSHLSNNFKSINHIAFFLMWSNVKCSAEVKRYVLFIPLFYEAYYLIKGRNQVSLTWFIFMNPYSLSALISFKNLQTIHFVVCSGTLTIFSGLCLTRFYILFIFPEEK